MLELQTHEELAAKRKMLFLEDQAKKNPKQRVKIQQELVNAQQELASLREKHKAERETQETDRTFILGLHYTLAELEQKLTDPFEYNLWSQLQGDKEKIKLIIENLQEEFKQIQQLQQKEINLLQEIALDQTQAATE